MSDIDVSAEIARLNAARDQDAHEEYLKASEAITGKQSTNPVATWVRALPKNITVGVMDAGIAMAHAADDFDTAMADNQKQKARAQRGEGVEGGPEPTAQELRLQSLATPMAESHRSDVLPAVINFRDWMASGSSTSDEITQSVAQYAIPFMGFSKLVGGLRGASWLGTAARTATAESATAGTVLEPHSGRGADLLAMGRTVEGKFGEALRTVSPDGSALNAYIDYMTDRDGETTGEGRFKNIIDNLALTGAVSGLIKVTAGTLKGGLAVAQYAAENAGVGPVGPAAQGGKIVFHGTPHDFNEFDSSKIGTGEGYQAYGHGLYFAENPETGQFYRNALSRRGVQPGTPMDHALNAMQISGGDIPGAYKNLTTLASRTKDAEYRQSLETAAGIVKAGNAKPRGALMHVDIPDEQIGKMLDHDVVLGKQPEILAKIPAEDKQQLERMLEDHNQDGDLHDFTGNEFRQIVQRAINEGYLIHDPARGSVGNAAQDASDYLNSHGIPGIKYLDQSSRGAAEGTRNIVLFDAKHAKIVKKE